MSKATNSCSSIISLKQAVGMTSDYRNNKDSILAGGIPPDVLPICETYEKSDFETLLNQPGCVKVRVYFGMKEGKAISTVIVGVNSDNEDMVSPTNPDYTDIILDDAERCPNMCPPPSVLN
jgi:hypothetical protein